VADTELAFIDEAFVVGVTTPPIIEVGSSGGDTFFCSPGVENSESEFGSKRSIIFEEGGGGGGGGAVGK